MPETWGRRWSTRRAGDWWKGDHWVMSQKEKSTTALMHRIEKKKLWLDQPEWRLSPNVIFDKRKGRRAGTRRSGLQEQGVFALTSCHQGSWLFSVTFWTQLTRTSQEAGGWGGGSGRGNRMRRWRGCKGGDWWGKSRQWKKGRHYIENYGLTWVRAYRGGWMKKDRSVSLDVFLCRKDWGMRWRKE